MSKLDFYLLIQINLFMSFISFRFYLVLTTKKYVTTEKWICFKKKLTGRKGLITKQYISNLFPIFISIENIVKIRSYHVKTKWFKILQDFICVFRNALFILNTVVLPFVKTIKRYFKKVRLP